MFPCSFYLLSLEFSAVCAIYFPQHRNSMENLWKIFLSTFLDMTEVLKSRVRESKPQWYSWNVRNLVSSLCRIMCGCPLKIPGNTLVWNSCGGTESSDVRSKKSVTKKSRDWSLLHAGTWTGSIDKIFSACTGFVFGMLKRNFSMPSEVVQTGVGQKTWGTTGHCSDQLTATPCTWGYSVWAWNCDLGSPCSSPAANALWPLHYSLPFHQVFLCIKYIFWSRLLVT